MAMKASGSLWQHMFEKELVLVYLPSCPKDLFPIQYILEIWQKI